MSSNDMKLLLYLSIGAVIGCGMFWRGFGVRRRKKLIENIPTSKVRSVAVGLVEVKGTAELQGDVLKSPFALRDCVYYQYKVEEYRSSGKSGRWVTLKQGESHHPFYVKDETGRMLVLPIGAEMHLAVDHKYGTGMFSDDDGGQFQAGLGRLGISSKAVFGFKRSLRCEEIYLEPGDNIYVMGAAMDNPAVSGSAVGTENLWIRKSESDVLLISDKTEKSLAGSLHKKLLLLFYGGPALTLGCLVGIVTMLLG